MVYLLKMGGFSMAMLVITRWYIANIWGKHIYIYNQRINNMILRELWDILTIKNGIKWDVLYDTTIDIIGLMDLGVPENG